MSHTKTGTAHGAENIEIVPHGPSKSRFEPATFQSQFQHSTGTSLNTWPPLWLVSPIGLKVDKVHCSLMN